MERRGPGRLLPHRLGPYELFDHIGRGGMADVYLCEDLTLGRRVALKVMLQRFLGDPTFVERFRRELRDAGQSFQRALITERGQRPQRQRDPAGILDARRGNEARPVAERLNHAPWYRRQIAELAHAEQHAKHTLQQRIE